MVEGRLPTVPEYYQEHINRGVNLLDEPKQCCPFHEENTPSFSFNPKTGRWSCFGKCHAHGDVVDMHQRVYHIESREEAYRSLRSLYKVSSDRALSELNRMYFVEEDKVDDQAVYAEACALANTPERWVELDYAMSKCPFDRWNIMDLLYKWKGKKSALS